MDERATRRSGLVRRLRRNRRNKKRPKLSAPSFLRDWWVEIAVALLIVAAVFLLAARIVLPQSMV
jgi:hypothetical protein